MKSLNSKIISLIAALLLAEFSLFFGVNSAAAQTPKSYFFSNFAFTIKINPDSTLDVTEEQTYNFTGEFHQAFRFIPLDKIDGISNISVSDAQTGQPLGFSFQKLNKLDPASWNKYTYYRQKGSEYIEWYYNLAFTTHTWIVKYKVHGALGFFSNTTQLYWNVFSGFDVPISNASANIYFPAKLESSQVKIENFRTNGSSVPFSFAGDGNSVHIEAKDFAPSEALTFNLQMPAGTVSKSSYWLDFLKFYYGYAGALAIIFATLLIQFLIWLKREKLNQGTGVVIAQYEPPENLKPAMAEAVLTEKVSTKGLTATIVDLAVRGYLKIDEDTESGKLKRLVGVAANGVKVLVRYLQLIILGMVFLVIFNPVGADFNSGLIIVSVILVVAIIFVKIVAKSKDYIVTLLKTNYEGDSGLEEYEKIYLRLLFKGSDMFSTSSMRLASNIRKREIYVGMQKVRDEIYKNTQADTKAFVVDPYQARKLSWFSHIIFIVLLIAFVFHVKTGVGVSQLEIIFGALLVCGSWLAAYVKYEARLNKQGALLKENWKGFKLYLKTAERYRLQNLTPDLFQKYLPYAMVFGIEKEWSKAFAGMDVPPPSWYGAGTAGFYAGSVSSGIPSGGFSPDTFSTSFSTAFSSAFASSGAGGGGGGGGGGAGGGGGGGGGGAS